MLFGNETVLILHIFTGVILASTVMGDEQLQILAAVCTAALCGRKRQEAGTHAVFRICGMQTFFTVIESAFIIPTSQIIGGKEVSPVAAEVFRRILTSGITVQYNQVAGLHVILSVFLPDITGVGSTDNMLTTVFALYRGNTHSDITCNSKLRQNIPILVGFTVTYCNPNATIGCFICNKIPKRDVALSVIIKKCTSAITTTAMHTCYDTIWMMSPMEQINTGNMTPAEALFFMTIQIHHVVSAVCIEAAIGITRVANPLRIAEMVTGSIFILQ